MKDPGCHQRWLNVWASDHPENPDQRQPEAPASRPACWRRGGRLGLLLAGCVSSLIGPASTTSTSSAASLSSTPTTGVSGAVGVAFPVVACTSPLGAPLGTRGGSPPFCSPPSRPPWSGKVEFYIGRGPHRPRPRRLDMRPDSRESRAPRGWSLATRCSQPVGKHSRRRPTGRLRHLRQHRAAQGVGLVCPYFTVPSGSSRGEVHRAITPVGEQSSMPTPGRGLGNRPTRRSREPGGVGRLPAGYRHGDLPPGRAPGDLRIARRDRRRVVFFDRRIAVSHHSRRLRCPPVPGSLVRRSPITTHRTHVGTLCASDGSRLRRPSRDEIEPRWRTMRAGIAVDRGALGWFG